MKWLLPLIFFAVYVAVSDGKIKKCTSDSDCEEAECCRALSMTAKDGKCAKRLKKNLLCLDVKMIVDKSEMWMLKCPCAAGMECQKGKLRFGKCKETTATTAVTTQTSRKEISTDGDKETEAITTEITRETDENTRVTVPTVPTMETDPPEPETEPPKPKTEPPEPETDPTEPETDPPEPETETPEPETETPEPETETPLPEIENPETPEEISEELE